MSKGQFDRVWSYIESGRAEGAKIVLGGEKRQTNGYWVDPTSKKRNFLPLYVTYIHLPNLVFTDVNPSMKIVREEV